MLLILLINWVDLSNDLVIDDVISLLRACNGDTCSFISKDGNGVTHTLAKLCFVLNVDVFWFEGNLDSITTLIANDIME